MQEAEEYFAVFRDKMLPTFAFIHLSPDLTGQRLYQDRPFLFRAIIAVAAPSTHQKLAYGKELKRILAQTTLVENRSSIDLLLGLLTFIAWSHDQILNKSGTLSRLILLAMSLACDLRLNTPIPRDEHMMKTMVDIPCKDTSEDPNRRLGIEEQRAVLACYVLSSMCVITFLFRIGS